MIVLLIHKKAIDDMALKRRVALIQEDNGAKTELVEALGRDLERLSGGLPS